MEIATVSPKDWYLWLKEMKLARGTAYLMSKGHRYSGILLSLFILAHMYTLSGLADPVKFQKEMDFFSHPFFMFLEWCLVIPLAFHAFNGLRLILFELFHQREDDAMVKWTISLSSIFILLMAVVMLWQTQTVTSFLFWSIAIILMGISLCFVWQAVWPTYNQLIWKMQRVTGSMLIALALAHYMFMHLNIAAGHNAEIILGRMKNPFTLLIDFILLSTVTLHGWYGLTTVINDDVSHKLFNKISRYLLTFIAIIVFLVGLKILTFSM